jgi:hypothetical protein
MRTRGLAGEIAGVEVKTKGEDGYAMIVSGDANTRTGSTDGLEVKVMLNAIVSPL